MLVSSKILVHIGYHKTATSLLQAGLFQRTSEGFYSDPAQRQNIPRAFISPQALADPDPADTAPLRRMVQATPDGCCAVISHERLCGYPASGGIDQEIIARRIKATFPDALILMVCREQKSAILSMYLQYVRDGGALTLHRYLSGVDRKLFRRPQFEPGYYEYHRALGMYQDLFGSDRVLCLPFEMIRSDSAQFLRLLATFVGVNCEIDNAILSKPVNLRSSMLAINVHRLLNTMVRTQLSDYGIAWLGLPHVAHAMRTIEPLLALLKAADQALMDGANKHVEAKFRGRFKSSNVRLGSMAGFNPAEYGYEV